MLENCLLTKTSAYAITPPILSVLVASSDMLRHPNTMLRPAIQKASKPKSILPLVAVITLSLLKKIPEPITIHKTMVIVEKSPNRLCSVFSAIKNQSFQ